MKHTKEPWHSHPFSNMWDGHYKTEIRNDTREIAASVYISDNPETAAANAQRIVECVNAMAGVADPANAITAAREALEMFLSNYRQDCDPDGEEIERAVAALALLKGVGA